MENHEFMEEMYEAAVKQLRTIVFEINYITGQKYCSPLFRECFGVDTIQNENFMEDPATDGIVYEEDVELYRTLFANRKGEQTVTCRFVTKSGTTSWYKIVLQYELQESGEVAKVIGTMKDVSDEIRPDEFLEGAGRFCRFALGFHQCRDEHVLHECGLAGSGDTRNADDRVQRNTNVQILQIVFGCAVHLNVA